MKNTTFDGLVRELGLHTMPALAGQRVRVAELIVEVSGRTVLHIVRGVYFVLTFDPQGRVDTDRLHRQQRALAGLAIDAVSARDLGAFQGVWHRRTIAALQRDVAALQARCAPG